MDFSRADYTLFEQNLSPIFATFVFCFPSHVHRTPINLDRACKHILRKRENSPHCVSLTLVSCYICCWARFKILKIQGKQISLALIMHLLMCASISGVYLKMGPLSLLAILFLIWKGDLKVGHLETQPVGGFAIAYLSAKHYISYFVKLFFWHNPVVTFWNKKLITLLFIPVPLIHNCANINRVSSTDWLLYRERDREIFMYNKPKFIC